MFHDNLSAFIVDKTIQRHSLRQPNRLASHYNLATHNTTLFINKRMQEVRSSGVQDEMSAFFESQMKAFEKYGDFDN